MSDGGTEEAKHRRVLEYPVQARRGFGQANPPGREVRAHPLKRDEEAFGPETG
jgi:hypothetical protein